MLRRIVDFSLENRPLVLIAAVLMILGGGYALTQLPIDVQPDITNVQVQVLTKAPALGPVEMEQFITYPIEAAMNGLPRLHEIRSISRYGLSAVTVVFEDGVDVYFARQLVNERLSQAREAIPPGLGSPEMGPVTTGLGDVFQFTVEGEGVSAMERRTILDWLIAPRLRAVPGVTEVNAWGGLPKQYQVVVDPAKLLAYRIALKDVFEAVERGTRNAGGGYIEHNREQYILRGEGLVESLADIEKIVLKAGEDGTPVTVGSVAQVREGAMLRIGVATIDGRGETVIGLVQMLAGENALQVATRARQAVEELQPSLPKGVRIVPYYDRAVLVRRVIRTVETNLLEGALLVVAVLFAFLGNIRAGLIVASAIPLSMLLAFTGMVESRISANLMSLGAIDFGLIVDGAVVLVENIVRRLGEPEGRDKTVRQLTAEAAHEVVRPITFGIGIIIIVYLPILTLGGIEGKMFKPMAWTVVFALAGSLLLTLTLTPVLASLFLRKTGHEHEPRFVGRLRGLYLRALDACFSHRALVLSAGLVAVAAGGLLATRLGGEFIPRLDEGDISISAIRPASVAISEVAAGTGRMERVLKRFPEVIDRGQPLGQPGAGDRRHGHRARGRVRDAEAPLRVDDGSHQGGAGREDERGPGGGRARDRLLLHPADRDALQRADRRGPLGRGGQALRRRPRHAAREGRGDRPGRGRRPRRRRREAGADGGPAGDPRPRRPRPLRPLRHLGRRRARHRRGRPRREGGGDRLRGPAPLLARRAPRRRGDPHPRRARERPRRVALGRERPAGPARRDQARHRAGADQPGGGPPPDRRRDERARARRGVVRGRGPRSASRARCSSPTATTSAGAGSSRTSQAASDAPARSSCRWPSASSSRCCTSPSAP